MLKKKPSEIFSPDQLKSDVGVQSLIEASIDRAKIELQDAQNRVNELQTKSGKLDLKIDLLKLRLPDGDESIDPNDPFLKANGIKPEDLETGHQNTPDTEDRFLAANNLNSDLLS